MIHALGLLRGAVWRPRISLSRRQRANSSAEYAIVIGMIMVFLLAMLQISLIIAQYYSTMQVTRATARWLAVNMNTIDSAVTTKVGTLAADLPVGSGSWYTTLTVSPACASLTSGVCSGRNQGDAFYVEITPNPARVTFLPTTIGYQSWQFTLPTTMPAYRVTMLWE
ncbi:MAG: hypothetical protein U0821_08535 [Chloroflexota bacterium]